MTHRQSFSRRCCLRRGLLVVALVLMMTLTLVPAVLGQDGANGGRKWGAFKKSASEKKRWRKKSASEKKRWRDSRGAGEIDGGRGRFLPESKKPWPKKTPSEKERWRMEKLRWRKERMRQREEL
mmetsp:Transcript_12914/g.36388  ORF Transcript_12914/g.36388 Transcript_12914/m.36388 type:complete len:124 (+) Transcript_12914:256-627(+)